MSEQPEDRDQRAPGAAEPEGSAQQDGGRPERPKYTPPSYAPPVSLDKDRGNPTEPIPSNPTQPLPPGAPPLPGAARQAPAGQQPGQPQGFPAPSASPSVPPAQPPAAHQGPAYPAAAYPPGPAYPGPQGYGNQQAYPGQGVPPGYGQYAYAPPEPRGLSIAAMVCGISVFVGFGFFGLPQIAAVVLGHLGLAREPAGRGMALAGLIMGYVGIGLTIAGLLFFVILLNMAQNSRYGY